MSHHTLSEHAKRFLLDEPAGAWQYASPFVREGGETCMRFDKLTIQPAKDGRTGLDVVYSWLGLPVLTMHIVTFSAGDTLTVAGFMGKADVSTLAAEPPSQKDATVRIIPGRITD